MDSMIGKRITWRPYSDGSDGSELHMELSGWPKGHTRNGLVNEEIATGPNAGQLLVTTDIGSLYMVDRSWIVAIEGG